MNRNKVKPLGNWFWIFCNEILEENKIRKIKVPVPGKLIQTSAVSEKEEVM